MQDRNAALARRGSGSTKNLRVRLQDALIAIVEQENIQRSCSRGTNDVGVVLRVEPVHGIHGVECSRLQSKITLVAKLPHDVAITSPVAIIDFDNPSLVAHGQHKSLVIGRVNDRVAVQPVWKTHGVTVHVELAIETVPNPDRIVVLIEIDQDVADNHRTGHVLLRGGEEDDVSVGNHGEVMMCADYGDVTAGAGGGGQSSIELGSSHLPDDSPGEVYLLRHRIYPVRVDSAVDNQKVPIRQKLDRIRKSRHG